MLFNKEKKKNTVIICCLLAHKWKQLTPFAIKYCVKKKTN